MTEASKLPGRFEAALLAAIQGEVKVIAEEEIAAAQERVATRVRQRIAAMSVELAKNLQFETCGQEVLIRLSTKDMQL